MCRLDENVRTAVLIVPLHVIAAAHVQPGDTESQPAVLARGRNELGRVRLPARAVIPGAGSSDRGVCFVAACAKEV